MRLLFVSLVPDHPWSGMGKWSHRLAAELRGLGHEVELRFSDDWPAIRSLGRLAVLLFPPVLALWISKRSRAWDVVVIHEPVALWYGLLRRFRRSLPPLVVMCHNVESRHFSDMVRASRQGAASVSIMSRAKNVLFRRWQTDGAIRLADVVMCLSRTDEQYLQKMNRNVFRMINGADPVTPDARPPAARNVLFVGGWLDLKGSRLLPRIWSRVRRDVPEARLTLVGTGAAGETVRADFAAEDRPSVSVTPRLETEDEMDAAFRAHQVFFMPSLSEGSPLSLVEAMAHGMTVVASRVGGIPDIANDGADALLFDSMDVSGAVDHLRRAITDPSLAARLGSAAVRTASTFTWRRSAEQMLAAVHAALERRE